MKEARVGRKEPLPQKSLLLKWTMEKIAALISGQVSDRFLKKASKTPERT
jgi:hypothetical protein